MGTTLQIESETAKKLRELAKARNISVDELLATYIPGLAVRGEGNGSQDKAQAFEDWATSFPADTPPLSDEAISRAAIYRDR